MLKIIILILALSSFLANQVSAITYLDDVKLKLNPNFQNTETNISWAILIEKYLLKLRHDLDFLKSKYDIKEIDENKNYSDILNKMIISIKKIQTIDIEKNTAEEIMNSIIKDLKDLNPKIKNYLKKKKEESELKTNEIKNNYWNLALKLSVSLTSLTNSLNSKLKVSWHKNYDKILKLLQDLEKENTKLKKFKTIQFNNPSEVKSWFLRILNNIKREILEIRKLLN